MADDKPMRFPTAPAPASSEEQFSRMPVSPEQTLKNGGFPTGWSPGLGVGTAPAFRGKIPWPEVKQPPTPFKGLSSGRK